MKLPLASFLLIATAGCTTAGGGAALGPNGRAVYHINNPWHNSTALYTDAHAKCPNGYNILSGPSERGLNVMMDIECK
jgi:hypothetical protein